MTYINKRRIDETGRQCSKCEVFKLWSGFSKNKHGTRGYQSWCRDCLREYTGAKKKKEYTITKDGRECSECGVFKLWQYFHVRRDLSTGHASACKNCMKKRTRRNMDNGMIRNRELKRKYGIDLNKYNEMVKTQGDTCAICNTKNKGKARGRVRYWSVDHSHETGEIRGLLCQQCNAILGMAKDSVDILESAIEYLCIANT